MRYRKIIGAKIGAGEVKVDQSAQSFALEQDIVGKQIGMDCAGGQIVWPLRDKPGQFGGNIVGKTSRKFVCGRMFATVKECLPRIDAEPVGFLLLETHYRNVHFRQRSPDGACLLGQGFGYRNAG